MSDLKKYLVIDEKKLKESINNHNRLGKLEVILNDKNYWINLFTYDGNRTALENFMLYRTAAAFNLYKSGFDDADITTPALNNLKDRLLSLPSVKEVKMGKEINEKDRAFLISLNNGKELYLESDTANSLMEDLGNFLRKIIIKTKEIPKGLNWAQATYIEKYNLDKSKSNNYYVPFRNYYFYILISKFPELLEDEIELECLRELEKRAQVTHTQNNLMLVPYGYNSARGFRLKTYKSNQKIQDRLDLTIVDLKEMLEDLELGDIVIQKRLNNNKSTLDSVKFLLDNKNILIPQIPLYTDKYKLNSIEGILENSKAINETLW